MRFLFEIIAYHFNRLFNFDQLMVEMEKGTINEAETTNDNWSMFNIDDQYFCLSGLPPIDFIH